MVDKFEECKIKGDMMICKVDTFFNAMGISDLKPDKVFEDWYPELDPSEFKTVKERIEAEQEYYDEEYKKFQNKVEDCIRDFMTSYPVKGVDDVDVDFDKNEVKVKISDKDEFLNSIRETMNGVGIFWADSNEELLEHTYPGDKDKVIVTHFGWLANAPEVYGTGSIRRCIQED